MEKTIQKPPYLKVISAVTAFIFCFSEVFLFASTGASVETLAPPQPSFQSPPIQSNQVVDLPKRLGDIQESYRGASDRTVILIQDAHANPDAQHSIDQIIRHFAKEYGIRHLALEGGVGKMDATLLRAYPERQQLVSILSEYIHRGELSGTVLAAVQNEYPLEARGVEDLELYEQETASYLEAIHEAGSLTRQLKRVRKAMQLKKNEVYNPTLLEFDKRQNEFERDPSSLSAFLDWMATIQAPTDYPRLRLYLREASRQTHHDNATFKDELRTLERQLALQFQNQTIQKEMAKQKQAYDTSQIDLIDYASYLTELLGSAAEQSVSQALRQEIQQRALLSTMQSSQFLKEWNAYLHEIAQLLLRSNIERELYEKDQQLKMEGRLLQLELPSDEWDLLSNIRDKYPKHARFYELAVARDEVFAEKLTNILKGPAKTVMFVAGGFHTAGVTTALKKEDISYVVLTPSIHDLPDHDRYREIMKGNISWKKYLNQPSPHVNPFQGFHQAVVSDVLNETSPKHLKQWRDELIRNLVAEKRAVESKQYTRFLDDAMKSFFSHSTHPDLRDKWQMKIKQFREGLSELISTEQLNDFNLMRLFAAPTSAPITDKPLFPNLLIRKNINSGTLQSNFGQAASETRAITEQSDDVLVYAEQENRSKIPFRILTTMQRISESKSETRVAEKTTIESLERRQSFQRVRVFGLKVMDKLFSAFEQLGGKRDRRAKAFVLGGSVMTFAVIAALMTKWFVEHFSGTWLQQILVWVGTYATYLLIRATMSMVADYTTQVKSGIEVNRHEIHQYGLTQTIMGMAYFVKDAVNFAFFVYLLPYPMSIAYMLLFNTVLLQLPLEHLNFRVLGWAQGKKIEKKRDKFWSTLRMHISIYAPVSFLINSVPFLPILFETTDKTKYAVFIPIFRTAISFITARIRTKILRGESSWRAMDSGNSEKWRIVAATSLLTSGIGFLGGTALFLFGEVSGSILSLFFVPYVVFLSAGLFSYEFWNRSRTDKQDHKKARSETRALPEWLTPVPYIPARPKRKEAALRIQMFDEDTARTYSDRIAERLGGPILRYDPVVIEDQSFAVETNDPKEADEHQVRYLRVGPLFFIDFSQMDEIIIDEALHPEVLIDAIKKRLGSVYEEIKDNIFFISPLSHTSLSERFANLISSYSILMVGAMLANHEALDGAIVADLGSGRQGFLGRIALRMGARVNFVDIEPGLERWLKLEGWRSGISFGDEYDHWYGNLNKRRFRRKLLKDPGFLKTEIFLMNIGPWNQYGDANRNGISLITEQDSYEHVKLVINGGFLLGVDKDGRHHRREMAETNKILYQGGFDDVKAYPYYAPHYKMLQGLKSVPDEVKSYASMIIAHRDRPLVRETTIIRPVAGKPKSETRRPLNGNQVVDYLSTHSTVGYVYYTSVNPSDRNYTESPSNIPKLIEKYGQRFVDELGDRQVPQRKGLQYVTTNNLMDPDEGIFGMLTSPAPDFHHAGENARDALGYVAYAYVPLSERKISSKPKRWYQRILPSSDPPTESHPMRLGEIVRNLTGDIANQPAVVIKAYLDGDTDIDHTGRKLQKNVFTFILPQNAFNRIRPVLEEKPWLLYDIIQKRNPIFYTHRFRNKTTHKLSHEHELPKIYLLDDSGIGSSLNPIDSRLRRPHGQSHSDLVRNFAPYEKIQKEKEAIEAMADDVGSDLLAVRKYQDSLGENWNQPRSETRSAVTKPRFDPETQAKRDRQDVLVAKRNRRLKVQQFLYTSAYWSLGVLFASTFVEFVRADLWKYVLIGPLIGLLMEVSLSTRFFDLLEWLYAKAVRLTVKLPRSLVFVAAVGLYGYVAFTDAAAVLAGTYDPTLDPIIERIPLALGAIFAVNLVFAPRRTFRRTKRFIQHSKPLISWVMGRKQTAKSETRHKEIALDEIVELLPTTLNLRGLASLNLQINATHQPETFVDSDPGPIIDTNLLAMEATGELYSRVMHTYEIPRTEGVRGGDIIVTEVVDGKVSGHSEPYDFRDYEVISLDPGLPAKRGYGQTLFWLIMARLTQGKNKKGLVQSALGDARSMMRRLTHVLPSRSIKHIMDEGESILFETQDLSAQQLEAVDSFIRQFINWSDQEVSKSEARKPQKRIPKRRKKSVNSQPSYENLLTGYDFSQITQPMMWRYLLEDDKRTGEFYSGEYFETAPKQWWRGIFKILTGYQGTLDYLDIGTGALVLPRFAKNYTANLKIKAIDTFDIDHNEIPHTEDIDFEINALPDTGYPDESFDVITSNDMMQYIPQHEIQASIQEMARLLRPGGIIAFTGAHEKALESIKARVHQLEELDKAKVFNHAQAFVQNGDMSQEEFLLDRLDEAVREYLRNAYPFQKEAQASSSHFVSVIRSLENTRTRERSRNLAFWAEAMRQNYARWKMMVEFGAPFSNAADIQDLLKTVGLSAVSVTTLDFNGVPFRWAVQAIKDPAGQDSVAALLLASSETRRPELTDEDLEYINDGIYITEDDAPDFMRHFARLYRMGFFDPLFDDEPEDINNLRNAIIPFRMQGKFFNAAIAHAAIGVSVIKMAFEGTGDEWMAGPDLPSERYWAYFDRDFDRAITNFEAAIANHEMDQLSEERRHEFLFSWKFIDHYPQTVSKLLHKKWKDHKAAASSETRVDTYEVWEWLNQPGFGDNLAAVRFAARKPKGSQETMPGYKLLKTYLGSKFNPNDPSADQQIEDIINGVFERVESTPQSEVRQQKDGTDPITMETLQSPYGVEQNHNRPYALLNYSYRLTKDFEALEGNPAKVLLIGVGRGVTALEMAAKFPNLSITAINRETGVWNDERAFKEVATKGYSQTELQEASNRVNLEVLDIEDSAQLQRQLGNKQYDFVVFELAVEKYLKDKLRVYEYLYNNYVRDNGIFALLMQEIYLGDEVTSFSRDEAKEIITSAFEVIATPEKVRPESGLAYKYRKTTSEPLSIPLKLLVADPKHHDVHADVSFYESHYEDVSKSETRLTVDWVNPNAQIILDTITNEFSEFPPKDDLRTSLQSRDIPTEEIEDALTQLYQDPTQSIRFSFKTEDAAIQSQFTEVLEQNRESLIGPANRVLVREGTPGETDDEIPTVQWIGTDLIFTFFDTENHEHMIQQLESLIASVQSENIAALNNKQTVVGLDGDDVESYMSDVHYPFLREWKESEGNAPFDNHDRWREQIESFPRGTGVFERTFNYQLPEKLDRWRAIGSTHAFMMEILFHQAGYHAKARRRGGWAVISINRIVRVKAREHLGMKRATYFLSSDFRGRAPSHAGYGNAYTRVDRPYSPEILNGEAKRKENELSFTLEVAEGLGIDSEQRHFVEKVLKYLISKLKPKSEREMVRNDLKAVTAEEEAHAEHQVFVYLSQADRVLTNQELIAEFWTNKVSSHLSKVGSPLLERYAPPRYQASLEMIGANRGNREDLKNEGRDYWSLQGGLVEAIANIERILESEDIIRQFLYEYLIPTRLIEAMQKELGEEGTHRPSSHEFFGILLGAYFYDHLRTEYETAEAAINAFEENPEGMLRDLLREIYTRSFYSREIREEILATDPGVERANLILDHANPGERITPYQLDHLLPQFRPLTFDQVNELIRERSDFEEIEPGVFMKAQSETRIHTWRAYSPGRHGRDEDSSIIKKVDEDGVTNGLGVLMVVADGTGGKSVSRTVINKIKNNNLFENALRTVNGDVKQAIFLLTELLRYDPEIRFELAGSTFSVVYYPKGADKAYYGVLGDSPILFFDENQNLLNRPRYHSVKKPYERRRLRKLFGSDRVQFLRGSRRRPKRYTHVHDATPVNELFNRLKQNLNQVTSRDPGYYVGLRHAILYRSLMLTRDMGSYHLSEILSGPAFVGEVDFTQVNGNVFALVASDGLLDLAGQNAESDIREIISDVTQMNARALKLVEKAGGQYAADDVTVLLLLINRLAKSETRLAPIQKQVKGDQPEDIARRSVAYLLSERIPPRSEIKRLAHSIRTHGADAVEASLQRFESLVGTPAFASEVATFGVHLPSWQDTEITQILSEANSNPNAAPFMTPSKEASDLVWVIHQPPSRDSIISFLKANSEARLVTIWRSQVHHVEGVAKEIEDEVNQAVGGMRFQIMTPQSDQGLKRALRNAGQTLVALRGGKGNTQVVHGRLVYVYSRDWSDETQYENAMFFGRKVEHQISQDDRNRFGKEHLLLTEASKLSQKTQAMLLTSLDVTDERYYFEDTLIPAEVLTALLAAEAQLAAHFARAA